MVITHTDCKISKVLPQPDGPRGGANLRFFSPQPDTSLHCETMDTRLVYRAVCPVYSPAFASTHCAYLGRDGQAELTWVAGYIPRWFIHPQMVTHPSTNRAQRRVTSLIETNALPLSQTTTPCTLD